MARNSRRSSQSLTIRTVAERAGVSTMTVSNVLSGKKRVQDATREAVLKAVADLGYSPNPAAQALASAATVRIGLLYHNVENAFLSSLMVGAVSGATRLGAQLLIRAYDQLDLAAAAISLRSLVASGANAILLPPPICEMVNDSDLLDEISLPLIALAPGNELRRLDSVRIDDFGAVRDITRQLIAMGHRRIAFVRASATHLIRWSRYEGYLSALQEAGIEHDPALVVDGTLRFESGLVAATALLGLRQRPTAIVCSNDDMAAGVVSVVHRAGLHIPDDVSVVGFDDSPIAVKIWPALTTVRQPIAAMAERAVEIVVEQLRRNDQTRTAPTVTYLPYNIIHRESVARLAVKARERS